MATLFKPETSEERVALLVSRQPRMPKPRCYRCKRIVGHIPLLQGREGERCAALCFCCVKYVWHDFEPVAPSSDICAGCGYSAWSAWGLHNGTTAIDHLNKTMTSVRTGASTPTECFANFA